MLDVAADIMLLAGRKYPEDLAKPGQQVPLFFGPCFYCLRGYTTHLPCECPTCGAVLRRVVQTPRWALRGRLSYRVWLHWMFFRLRLREAIGDSVWVLLNVVAQSERTR